MDIRMNKIKDWFYFLPIRIKLLLVSGLVFLMLVLMSNYFLNHYSELSLKDQFTVSSKRTVNIIAQLLHKNISSENLKDISKIDFIEKISVTYLDGSQMHEWDSEDYLWDQLKYFKIEFPDNPEVSDISIAINHEKYMASNQIKLSNFNKFTFYITSLITLLIILIVNLLVIGPIDSISNNLDKYSDAEDEFDDDDDDDKSRSQIIELSKTIGPLKRSIGHRREKELQLVAIQMRLSSVLNSIGDAIITINKDSNIVMVNPAFERIWGHSKDNVIGKKLEDMMPEKYRSSHKAGLERYLTTGVEHVINQNLELEALLAGEMSGHVFFNDKYYGYDDALYAALRLISILSRSDKTLAEIKDAMPAMVNTPELRFQCDDEIKFQIVDEVKARLTKAGVKINSLDGVRVNSEEGWWLLRASNTQDVLVARCEASNDEDLDLLKSTVFDQLKQSGVHAA